MAGLRGLCLLVAIISFLFLSCAEKDKDSLDTYNHDKIFESHHVYVIPPCNEEDDDEYEDDDDIIVLTADSNNKLIEFEIGNKADFESGVKNNSNVYTHSIEEEDLNANIIYFINEEDSKIYIKIQIENSDDIYVVSKDRYDGDLSKGDSILLEKFFVKDCIKLSQIKDNEDESENEDEYQF